MVVVMSQIQLLSVASQQARWLTLRQSTIADNLANASTPGFKPSDVEPFDKIVEKAGFSLRATAGGHVSAGSDGLKRPGLTASESWEIAPSGNAVSLEQELIKADEVNRAYAMNAGIVKAFHKMLLMSVK